MQSTSKRIGSDINQSCWLPFAAADIPWPSGNRIVVMHVHTVPPCSITDSGTISFSPLRDKCHLFIGFDEKLAWVRLNGVLQKCERWLVIRHVES